METHLALAGSERSVPDGATRLGPSDAEERIGITLKLCRKAPLPDVPDRLLVPMSRAVLESNHGACTKDVQKVLGVLKRYGLTIVESNERTRSIRAEGPASAMETAFQVKLVRYQHDQEVFRGRTGPVCVPKELDGIVVGLFGLDNRRMVERHRAASTPRLPLSAADVKGRTWLTPSELAKMYSFPDGDGSGQAIGLIEFGGGFFQDDLDAFCRIVGAPNTAKVVPVSVDDTPIDVMDNDAAEVMLDVEVVAGLCPAATIPIHFAPPSERGWIDALDQSIHDEVHTPSVLSISWGMAEGEQTWTEQALDHINESLKEAALMGVTVCVATGDNGSQGGVGDGFAHVAFPASSQYVLAVGGTMFRRSEGKPPVEVGWKEGDGLVHDNGGSSGGGNSVFARPKWQTVDIDPINPGASAGRVTPDVAALAGFHDYFLVVDQHGTPHGGTSAATPLWAALIARVNAMLEGQTVGYLTPLLYQKSPEADDTLGAEVCDDITSGNNATATRVGGYEARQGYDAVTGWGSPNGKRLAAVMKKIIPAVT